LKEGDYIMEDIRPEWMKEAKNRIEELLGTEEISKQEEEKINILNKIEKTDTDILVKLYNNYSSIVTFSKFQKWYLLSIIRELEYRNYKFQVIKQPAVKKEFEISQDDNWTTFKSMPKRKWSTFDTV
jgi:hypothetical protein